jgi:hypothetical protein
MCARIRAFGNFGDAARACVDTDAPVRREKVVEIEVPLHLYTIAVILTLRYVASYSTALE